MESDASMRWAGIDWGETEHSVHIIDDNGNSVYCFQAAHSAEGLEELIQRLREQGPIAGVAVEATRNLVVVKVLQAGLDCYAINPKLAAAWREGWTVAGAKHDPGDAEVLAHGLREHRDRLRRLRPEDPLTLELTLLCEDECDLIAQRTALINGLQATLRQYHPMALEWFSDWTRPSAWEFVLRFPRPQDLVRASAQKLRGFLKTHRLGLTRKWEERIESRARGPSWPCDPAVVEAKSVYAVALVKQLLALERTLKQYRERIEGLFDRHPDASLFSSLPGAGPKLAPRLLACMGTDRERYQSGRSVQQLSGAVPVTRRTGGKGKRGPKRSEVKFRRACQKGFRNTMHLFSSQSIGYSAWARAFYDQARESGQSHALALRNLSAKWLKIIYRMWDSRTPYDESVYIASLKRHGSPLAGLIPQETNC